MNLTPPTAKEKVKALDLALQQIEKQFGKGAIMKLGEEATRAGIEVIPTGSIGLDMALGVGGVPRGRIVEIYGPESSGKTTLALTIIANAQRAGGNAVMIDAEHALDAAYAQKLGVDIANLHVAQPDTGEEALEIADHLVRSGAVDVVVIDSVAALVPRAEIEGEMGDSHVGRGGVVAELHDRPFAELLLDLAHGEVECAFAVRVECHATSSCTGTGAARLHRCPTVTPAG